MNVIPARVSSGSDVCLLLSPTGGTQGLQDNGSLVQSHLPERALLSPGRQRTKVSPTSKDINRWTCKWVYELAMADYREQEFVFSQLNLNTRFFLKIIIVNS